MLIDGKPEHWPKMLEGPADDANERSAVAALARVRAQIVEHYQVKNESDWRLDFARTQRIENVVAGMLADVQASDEFSFSCQNDDGKLRDRIADLEEKLAEAKRPFTAQMEMQNRRIIAQTAQLDAYRLKFGRLPDDKQ